MLHKWNTIHTKVKQVKSVCQIDKDITNLSNKHRANVRVTGRANGPRLLNEEARLNKTACHMH